MKRLCILGSTGSIGQNALTLIKHHPEQFRVLALSTNANIDRLQEQIRDFHPSAVCVSDTAAAMKLRQRLKKGQTKILIGEEGLQTLVHDPAVEEVLLAISGAAALHPLLAAIEAGKDVALANKEALVMAGPIIIQRAKRHKVKLIPVDSEQSAIWQCLEGQQRRALKYIYLTASGGPLLDMPHNKIRSVTVHKVLRHPRWRMGKKITVDSATLMNKGLEVFEAIYLFGASPDMVRVVIHPESIIHSMVEFIDGVVLAQLSVTDMRIPIQYAFSYPKRLSGILPRLDFYRLTGGLHFREPDLRRFPCLALAYRAADQSGTAPCVLNAANEVCVEGFLKGNLAFIQIPRVIEKVLDRHRTIPSPSLDDVFAADNWARDQAQRILSAV